MRKFAQKFEWCARDSGIVKEDAMVYLVLVLNQDILSCLDAYVTMCGGDEMDCLETVQDILCHVTYI